MLEHLEVHTRVHLKFLARSRMLTALGALVVVGGNIGVVPVFFMGSGGDRFEMLKRVAEQLHETAGIVTGLLGLVTLWTHFSHRSIKMIATKPTPLGAWAASIFVAAAIAGFCAQAVVAAATFGLSRFWSVPYQWGFAYVAMSQYFQSLILLAVLTALGAAMHPVIAALVALFFTETTFWFLGTVLAGATEAGHRSFLVSGLMYAMQGLYYLTPVYSPFAEKTAALAQSLRVTAGDVKYLIGTVAYALGVMAAGYAWTLLVLRRRPLV